VDERGPVEGGELGEVLADGGDHLGRVAKPAAGNGSFEAAIGAYANERGLRGGSTIRSGCCRAGTRRGPRPRWSSASRRTVAAARPPRLGLDGCQRQRFAISVRFSGFVHRQLISPLTIACHEPSHLPWHPASFPVCMAISRPDRSVSGVEVARCGGLTGHPVGMGHLC
jgi:hypothetical protein